MVHGIFAGSVAIAATVSVVIILLTGFSSPAQSSPYIPPDNGGAGSGSPQSSHGSGTR